jgi:uncharacterized damage-inducible protein DinB
VPVVSRGDTFVFAQSIGDVAEFLGLDVDTSPQLAPSELVDKLDTILSAAQRYIDQFPAERLHENVLDRRRSYRELSYHVFRIAEAFLDAAEGGELTYDYYADKPPDDMRTAENITAYGETVRRRLLAWWSSAEDRSCRSTARTYFGEKPLHEVLERTTWHTGQHVRQIMMLLERMGIDPERPLTADDFAGLPMPQKVWDD